MPRINIILSLICIAGIVICTLILKSVQGAHNKAPDYQKAKKEREEAYKRKTIEESTPEELFNNADDVYDDSDYTDDDYSDEKDGGNDQWQ